MSEPFFTLHATYYLTHCPHCTTANWVCEPNDDIEAIKCWNCEKVAFFGELGNEICGYETVDDCCLVQDGQKSVEGA